MYVTPGGGNSYPLQTCAERWSPGYENTSGKFRQKWYATAGRATFSNDRFGKFHLSILISVFWLADIYRHYPQGVTVRISAYACTLPFSPSRSTTCRVRHKTYRMVRSRAFVSCPLMGAIRNLTIPPLLLRPDSVDCCCGGGANPLFPLVHVIVRYITYLL